MIMTRSHAITAAVAAAAALTATGITYATAAPAPQAAPAAAVQQAPAQVPMDGGTQSGNGGKGNEGNDHGGNDRGGNDHDRGGRDFDKGWIHINERSFSAHTRGCAVIVSGLGSTSLNIRNDSRKTIEVFRGVTCDNGAPIATVGPHSTSFGVTPKDVRGVHVKNGVVGSFRVIDRHDDDYGGDRGGDHGDDEGGY
ncbi:hypothetical protein GCM10014715_22980 [Streptomyces spiralis]|uniref:Uncharacterized protein n=2 Tax=Streptomyces spiralis TaxID=66376 RepID=A0A918ZSU9_9ACTN|nr:hypothetical protein [Streptomyces spiralis]GHE68652.1 hypothetical protein GCM10014715_22980 [Streptomyces spiralis]